MNLTERNDLIQTLLHDLEHELMGSNKTDAEQYAEVTSYQNRLYNLGAVDLLEVYEAWYVKTF